MPASSIQPGQRWVSNTESELGLGIVLEVANRRVEMSFPAAGEKRTYAIDNAPLSRVHYEVGQQISDLEGHELLITEVEEHNGCLIYLGTDENDQVRVLPELELNSFIQFNKPKERKSATIRSTGHRSVLSFNLNKLMRDIVNRNQPAAA